MLQRPRRNRSTPALRDLIAETHLKTSDFVWPVFVVEGSQKKEAIPALPGIYRWSLDLLIPQLKEALALGIRSFAFFPKVDESHKDSTGSLSLDPQFYLYKILRSLREEIPEATLITDVALDPYSSDGHDGIYKNGVILNDESVEILAKQALLQAQNGAHIVAPSDMMDGRIAAIRKTLDQNSFKEIGILSYAAKYASSFYGPFRAALDSAPKSGDKKTYQMDPRNKTEALRELRLDIEEGADMVMVKPALAYLDIIQLFKEMSDVPVVAYHVSGEYAMIKAAATQGLLDEQSAMLECLTSIKRAGADIIFSYYALEFAKLNKGQA
ncbi:MAG: porphobilinogen synthase [Bdellovibrionota bacterium]